MSSSIMMAVPKQSAKPPELQRRSPPDAEIDGAEVSWLAPFAKKKRISTAVHHKWGRDDAR
jgi:hypothetical protein